MQRSSQQQQQQQQGQSTTTPQYSPQQSSLQQMLLGFLGGNIGQGLPGFLPGAINPLQQQGQSFLQNILSGLGSLGDQSQSRIGDALETARRGLVGSEIGINEIRRFNPFFDQLVGQGVPGAQQSRSALSDIMSRMGQMGGQSVTGPGQQMLDRLIQSGMGTRADPLLGQVSGSLQDMLRTGSPTTTTPAFQAAQQVMQRNLADQIRGQQEQLGSTGRFSSAALQGAQDLRQRSLQDQNQLLTNLTLGAEEAARGRQLQTGGLLSNIGQFTSQLPLQALATVSPLAQSLSQLPLQERSQQLQALMGQGQLGMGQGQLALSEMAQRLAGAQAGTQAGLGELSAYAPFISMLTNAQMGGSSLPIQLQQTLSQIGGQALGQGQQLTEQTLQDMMRQLPQMNPLIGQALAAAFGVPLQGQTSQFSGGQTGRSTGKTTGMSPNVSLGFSTGMPGK